MADRLFGRPLWRLIISGLWILVCVAATFYSLVVLKTGIIYTHLFYVPIILVCAWWERKGILIASCLVVFLLVCNFLFTPSVSIADNLVRSIVLLFVSIVTSTIFERRRILARLLEERTMELRKAEQLATIGEVAGMVGHDLRNPLQAIVSSIDLAEKNLRTTSPPTVRKSLEKSLGTIGERVKYMDKIVSDLQDYARPLKPRLVETDLRQLVNGILSTVRITGNVEVSVLMEEGSPRLMVDREMMRRVFTNLITNALQAMPEGGRLSIRSSMTEDAAFIDIQDTGVGIPEENMEKLFKPLFTTKPKGTGFGLAVSKRLVEAHKGSITVKSTVGRGSTFTVKIPSRKEVS